MSGWKLSGDESGAELTYHVHPAVDGGSSHEMNGSCWCQPTVENRSISDTGRDLSVASRLYIHRETVDSPRVEPKHLHIKVDTSITARTAIHGRARPS